MRKSRALFLLLCAASLWPLSARSLEDAGQPRSETMETLSTQIHGQLESLRQQSVSLTEQLARAESELLTQSSAVEELRTELSGLNTSLTVTRKKLTEYSTTLTIYEEKLRFRKKVILTLIGVLLALTAANVIVIILERKRITDLL